MKDLSEIIRSEVLLRGTVGECDAFAEMVFKVHDGFAYRVAVLRGGRYFLATLNALAEQHYYEPAEIGAYHLGLQKAVVFGFAFDFF